MFGTKKNQQQPCISVNLTFLFSPVHVSTCIMPPKQQTIFYLSPHISGTRWKKQPLKIRKSMLTFLSGSLSADKVTHFMKHEPEVVRLLSEKTGSLLKIARIKKWAVSLSNSSSHNNLMRMHSPNGHVALHILLLKSKLLAQGCSQKFTPYAPFFCCK